MGFLDCGLKPLVHQVGGPVGEGNGNPLQYSRLENPMGRGAWQATVHGVARVGHDLVTKPPPLLAQKPLGGRRSFSRQP